MTLARSQRGSRDRVLIVGRAATIDPFSHLLPSGAVRVENLFDAIGEVTVAPVSEPISTVLVASDVARDSGRRAFDALRRVDPAMRLVLVANCQQMPADEPWVAEVFDDRIDAPVDAAALQRVLHGTKRTPSAGNGLLAALGLPDAPAPARGTEDDAPDTEPAAPRLDPPGADMAGDTPTPVADPAEATSWPAPEAPHQAPEEPPPPTSPEERLGDTDLVEAALNDPLGVQASAVRLIEQHTGWQDITLGPLDEAHDDDAGVEVAYGGQQFGRLRASGATSDELEPWAIWLARWLALDHAFREYRRLSYQDDLTGAWNRRFFERFLAEAIVQAGKQRRPVTLMVFDLDDFKKYNDQFGHEAGDVILRETVALLMSVIRQGDRVCRIGGDEFAVVFADPEGPREPGSTHPESVETIARRFQDQISQMKFPKLGLEAPGTLSISGGLATYPWDGPDAQTLLRRADRLALQSKRAGKNVITFGPGALPGS